MWASSELIGSVAAAAAHRICRRLLPVLGIFLLVLFSFVPIVVAQSRFDVWTTENGLPQNSVRDILQTRDGYLWLATEGGLVRFDGARFVVFDRSVPGIESQRVGALHEDRQGALWAGTWDGLLIRYQDGRFTTYTEKDGLPKAGLPGAGLARIEEDHEGSLWVTWVGAITRFDGQRFTNFASEDLAYRVAGGPATGYQYLDNWWSQDSTGLHTLVKGRVQTYNLHGGLLGGGVTGVNADRAGNIWIRTAGAGVFKVSDTGVEQYTTRDGLPSNEPEGLFYDDGKGSTWLLTRTYSVYRIRNRKHELMDISGPRAFFVDREGSTWLGTIASGLHRLRDASFTVLTERDGLSLDRTYSILEDRAGALWIGTWDGGVNRYFGGRFTSWAAADGLPSGRITCIYEDSSGRLWVGTEEGLAYLHDSRFRRYGEGAGFLEGSVWAIHEDREGTYWFATNSGLVKLRNDQFNKYTTHDGLSHNRITALFEDRSGVLWIGAFHGVTRLKAGVFRAFTEQDGLIGNEIRSFHQDSDGLLWMGTYDGGLYRLAGERLTRYTTQDGLHSNGVFQILEDNQGYFWIGSNTGIYRVSRRELNEFAEGRRPSITSVVFGTKDGLASLEVNGGRQPAGLKAADGRLWFPTMGGVAVVDPAAVESNRPPPRPIIEEFLLAGERTDFAREVEVPPAAPAFEIRYTAPTFIKPEQVRFRYRLVGLDDEWVEAGNRRSATFYRIPPGRYTFVVTASNHLGVWSFEAQSLEIVVLPPFWRTWWFMAAAVALVGIALFAGHERRVRRVRREHARQTAFTQQLIDSQERERSRISSEIHDSVGHGLAMVKKRAEAGKDLVARNDAAREEFTEIFTAAERIDMEMKEIARGLRPYHLDKIGLSRSIQGMLRRVERSCHLAIAADIADIDDVFERGSHVHVYRIVQEAISNVIRHSGATRARIAIARDSTSVEIRIEDNGQGLTPEPRDSADPAARGFGLMGMHERARILGGEIQIRSGETHGTTIVARFRLEDGGT